jgi:hypothetical protein
MIKKELIEKLIKEGKVSLDEALILLGSESTEPSTGHWIWHMGHWFWQSNTITTDTTGNPTNSYYTTITSNLK